MRTAFKALVVFLILTVAAYAVIIYPGLDGYKIPAQGTVPLIVDSTTGWLVPIVQGNNGGVLVDFVPNGATDTLVNLSAVTVDTNVWTAAATRKLRYYSLVNASDVSNAEVAFHSGVVSAGSCAGSILYYVNLLPHESFQFQPPAPVPTASGFCLNIIGGSVTLAAGRVN